MSPMKKSLTKILGLLLLGVLTLQAGKVPRPAAPLEAKTIDGRTITLNDLKGKVVAVMFFSTDCPHCQNTTQLLNPIYAEWKARGLEILGMAVNPNANTNLKAFAEQFGAKFPLALSSTSECNRFSEESVMRRFTVPYLLFVDRQGQVREEHPGADRDFWVGQQQNIPAVLDALLKERPKS
jgi:peroxiredoxin